MTNTEAPAPRVLDVREWLELTVQPRDPAGSRESILLLRDFVDAFSNLRDSALGAKVVLLESGELSAARFGDVFLAGGANSTDGHPVLHPELEADDEVVAFLRAQGVKVVNDEVLPVDVVQQIAEAADTGDTVELWRRLWKLMTDSSSRPTDVDEAFVALGERFNIRTDDVLLPDDVGGMGLARQMLLPGEVLDARSPDEDRRWMVQVDIADRFRRQLSEMGVTERPHRSGGTNPWEHEYRDFLKDFPDLKTTARINAFVNRLDSPPSHLELLDQLSDASKARLVKACLSAKWDDLARLDEAERKKDFLLWVIRSKGWLPSPHGPLRCDAALSPAIGDFARVLPIADVTTEEAEILGLRTDLGGLDDESLDRALTKAAEESSPIVIGRVLVLLSGAMTNPPTVVPALVGNTVKLVPPGSVAVVATQSGLQDHQDLDLAVVQVDSENDVNALVERWGMSRSVVQSSVKYDSAEEVQSIVDEYPGLLDHMGDSNCERFRCCIGLTRRISHSSYRDFQVAHHVEDHCAFIEVSDLKGTQSERDELILQKLIAALGLDLTKDQVSRILDSRNSAAARDTERECRDIALRSKETGLDLAAKILARLFSLPELLTLLPSSLADQIGEERNDKLAVAKMALAVWGVEILAQNEAKNILRRNGHVVPTAFAGLDRARSFVRNLGLDVAFAGFPGLDREKHLEIHPRTDPVVLHAYQQDVQAKMREFLRTPPVDAARGWRSLLYMPTGAGKTRVTVQSVVDALNEGELRIPRVIWIAGSDELCEQAVQTFAEVWRSTGASGMLSVERMWNSNETVEEVFDEDCAAQVVVATHQKLSANISDDKWHPEYEWLAQSGLVVIDEAHSAGGQSFTSILAALGFERGQRDRTKDPMPLLGLTATPKERIRSRFGGAAGKISIELPHGMTDFEFLKSEKVLSNVRSEVIKGELIVREGSEPLRENFPGNPWLPKAYDQQLESNEKRNKAIIDHIESQISDNKESLILVFAASVAHAQILSALLARRGIEAAAVSADTPRKLRQHYVREFKKGRIRVLTNFGVLTQGFDNPLVNVVYVTRPVFSAASYLQMVGRGLRGPLNGGTEECLIVDIEDNLEQFGDLKLVYTKVKDWFERGGDGDLPEDPEDLEED